MRASRTRRSNELVGMAVATALGLSAATLPQAASAATLEFTWQGLFTMIGPDTSVIINTSLPYFYDTTWGYGLRTQIAGTLTLDTATRRGTATVEPFEFFSGTTPVVIRGLSFESAGGDLLLGNMLADWNENYGIPASIVWDASGLFAALDGGPLHFGDTIAGTGALPATDAIDKGRYPIGPTPIATTTFDTTPTCTTQTYGDCLGINPIGTLPLSDDGIGGSPLVDGPFPGFSANFDITTLRFDTAVAVPAPVPLPPALWLFGSGLLGLLGAARRERGRQVR